MLNSGRIINPGTRLLSGLQPNCPLRSGSPQFLSATMGNRTIALARNVFDSVDDGFTDLNVSASPTPVTMFFVCKQACHVGSACVPGARNRWKELYGTQDQIIQLTIEHRKILIQNRFTTWFPFQCWGRFYAAGISMNGSGLSVRLLTVDHLQNLDFSDGRHQVVILQPSLLVQN